MGMGSEYSLGQLWPIPGQLNRVPIWCYVVGFFCVGEMQCPGVPDILLQTEAL